MSNPQQNNRTRHSTPQHTTAHHSTRAHTHRTAVRCDLAPLDDEAGAGVGSADGGVLLSLSPPGHILNRRRRQGEGSVPKRHTNKGGSKIYDVQPELVEQSDDRRARTGHDMNSKINKGGGGRRKGEGLVSATTNKTTNKKKGEKEGGGHCRVRRRRIRRRNTTRPHRT